MKQVEELIRFFLKKFRGRDREKRQIRAVGEREREKTKKKREKKRKINKQMIKYTHKFDKLMEKVIKNLYP